MRVHVRTNAEPVSKFIATLFRDQGPFARSLALNNTADRAQEVQRTHMQSFFTVRNRSFVRRAVKIRKADRATKTKHSVIVRLEPPGAPNTTDILAKFETETRKVPLEGPTIAVPLEGVRRTGSGKIAKRDRITGLDWTPVNDRVSIAQGGQLVRVMTGPATGVIFRRQRGSSTSLYVLVSSVPLTPGLDFERNIHRTASRVFEEEYRKAWEFALRTAR